MGTTPTLWTSTPMLVAPAVIAATNMSPERRVSWPTTSEPPAPTDLVGGRAPERERERRAQVDVGGAADAVRAEQAGHRGPRVMGRVRPGQGVGDGAAVGARPGSTSPTAAGVGVAGTVIVTVTVSGDTATRVTAEGSDGTTGTSWLPGLEARDVEPTTIGAAPSRSRSADGPEQRQQDLRRRRASYSSAGLAAVEPDPGRVRAGLRHGLDVDRHA